MKETILAFIDRINAHDVDGIVGLMADDYQFINSSGDRFRGLDFMRQTWRTQFTLHPDFHIRVERLVADDESVGVFGWAEGTYSPDGSLDEDNHWEVPSAFPRERQAKARPAAQASDGDRPRIARRRHDHARGEA